LLLLKSSKLKNNIIVFSNADSTQHCK